MSMEQTTLRIRAGVGVLMATSALVAGSGGTALAAPGTNNGDNGNHGQGNNGRGNGGNPGGGDPGGNPGGGDPGTGGGGTGGPGTDPDPQPPADPAAPAGLGGDTAVGVWCVLADDPDLPCLEDVAGS